MEHEGDNYTNCDLCFWHGNYRVIKGLRRFGSWRPSGDHPNNSIIENGQNTEQSPGDLLSLNLQGKTLMSSNNNNTPLEYTVRTQE